MATLKITDMSPEYDGEYALDISGFTNRELHQIKLDTTSPGHPGLRAGEFKEALASGDNDLVVAITCVVLRREGKVVDMDTIWDADQGCIQVDVSDEVAAEDEERPPAPSTPMIGGA